MHKIFQKIFLAKTPLKQKQLAFKYLVCLYIQNVFFTTIILKSILIVHVAITRKLFGLCN